MISLKKQIEQWCRKNNFSVFTPIRYDSFCINDTAFFEKKVSESAHKKKVSSSAQGDSDK